MVLKKSFKSAAGTFGGALSTLFLMPDPMVLAEVENITWRGGQASSSFFPLSYPFQGADIDQVPFGYNIGGAFSQFSSLPWQITPGNSIPEVRIVESGEQLSPATFSGTQDTDFPAPTQDFSAYIGFQTNVGNVGWFKVDFTETPNRMIFTVGEHGSMGETLVVGTNKPILGDVNCDGDINLLDVAPFVEALTNGEFIPKADINQDGAVNLLDVAPFVELLSG